MAGNRCIAGATPWTFRLFTKVCALANVAFSSVTDSASSLSFTSAFAPATVWSRFLPIDSNGMLFSRLIRLAAAVAMSSEPPPRMGMT